MGKYSKHLDETLVEKVKTMANACGLTADGVNVDAIRLLKTKNTVGVVLGKNELLQLYQKNDTLVVLALYEEAFLEVDEATQNMWIEGLLSQISYDFEKEKVVITKPELQVNIGMYQKYGNVAVQKAELAIDVIEQIHERERELKEMAKEAKKMK